MHFIGCDVSKATLDLACRKPGQRQAFVTRTVANTRRGWRALLRWAAQQCEPEWCVVLEATGVYHLKLAGYLSAAGCRVLVANPGRAAEFARSINQLHKTDRLDARTLQRYGEQLDAPHWFVPDSKEISHLKALLARLAQLQKDRQRERNRLERNAFTEGGEILQPALRRSIKRLAQDAQQIQQAIDALIQGDPALQRHRQLLCSIPGIGPQLSQWLLPLLSQQRFRSAREVAAFLGLTPRHRQSGSSLKTRGRLSGRGHATIRAKLYMPALSAIQHNPQMRALYETLLGRGKTKKQAIVAVMRKLVHLCYGVINTQTPYIENYPA
jgi:transposase